MKKILTFILTTVLAMSMLVGCGVAAVNALAIGDDALLATSLSLGETVLADPTNAEVTDTEVEVEVEDEPAIITIPENVMMEGIEVTGEKHPFNGTDVVILTVKNTLSENYSLTATITYYDADGKPIKTEAQTFDQYAAGYQNYFLFIPGITFEQYSFVIEGTPYDGVCYTANFTGEFSHVDLTHGDAQGEDAIPGKNMRVFSVLGAMHFVNTNDVAVDYSGYYVVFNHKGEIQNIVSRPSIRFDVYDETQDVGYKHWLAYKEVKEVVHYYRYDDNGNVTGFIPGEEPGFIDECDGSFFRAFVVVTNLTPVDGPMLPPSVEE